MRVLFSEEKSRLGKKYGSGREGQLEPYVLPLCPASGGEGWGEEAWPMQMLEENSQTERCKNLSVRRERG